MPLHIAPIALIIVLFSGCPAWPEPVSRRLHLNRNCG